MQSRPPAGGRLCFGVPGQGQLAIGLSRTSSVIGSTLQQVLERIIGAVMKRLTLRGAAARTSQSQQPLCAEQDGFNLHAAVRVAGSDRGRWNICAGTSVALPCRKSGCNETRPSRWCSRRRGQMAPVSGQLRVIAVVLDRATIRRILEHLGLQPQPPPRGR